MHFTNLMGHTYFGVLVMLETLILNLALCMHIILDYITCNVHLDTFSVRLESTIEMNPFESKVWSLVLLMGTLFLEPAHADLKWDTGSPHPSGWKSSRDVYFIYSVRNKDNMGYHKTHIKRKHMFGLTWEATVRVTERLGDARIRLGWFHRSAIRPLTQPWYRHFNVNNTGNVVDVPWNFWGRAQ